MDINTGKLASNSSNFIKKIKENDTNNQINKVKNKVEDFSDFIDKTYSSETNNLYKSRIKNIQKQFHDYETELSKTQYIAQQLDLIGQYVDEKNMARAEKLINQSQFDNKNILKEYFNMNSNIGEQLEAAREKITDQFSELDKKFNIISVTNQNLISLYASPIKNTGEMITNLDQSSLLKTTNIDNKRIIDLIS